MAMVFTPGLGAISAAIRCGPQQTGVDVDGLGSQSFQALRTVLGARGPGLDVYG